MPDVVRGQIWCRHRPDEHKPSWSSQQRRNRAWRRRWSVDDGEQARHPEITAFGAGEISTLAPRRRRRRSMVGKEWLRAWTRSRPAQMERVSRRPRGPRPVAVANARTCRTMSVRGRGPPGIETGDLGWWLLSHPRGPGFTTRPSPGDRQSPTISPTSRVPAGLPRSSPESKRRER
jgi:hypothetical protein